MAEKIYQALGGQDTPVQLLYAKTDGGRIIIEHYYPQSCDYFGTKKHFKLRPEERTASASVYLKDGVWHVHDFGGGEGHPLDAIEVCMKEENVDWNSALHLLLNRYGVCVPKVFQKSFIKEPLAENDKPGDFEYVPDVLTASDLSLFGRYVKADHMESLGWRKAKQVRIVLQDGVWIKKSVEGVPIFVRECRWKDSQGQERVFYKTYEPMSHNKAFRFRYYGEKPAHYINGLAEAKKMHAEEIARDVAVEKQSEVIITCGDRDAVNAYSFGVKVVWFNSETYTPSPTEMQEIRELGSEVILVPDIDETGVKRGIALALLYPWLKVAWLPTELKDHKDWRGNPMKDLRDWGSLGHGQKDFHALIHSAKPADYFVADKNSALHINMEYLHNFLHLHGYATYDMKIGDKVSHIMVHRNGYILEVIDGYEKIISFLLTHFPTPDRSNEKYNLITSSKLLSERNLLLMPLLDCELDKPQKGEEKYYFLNCVVTITAEGLTLTKTADYRGLTLECNVIKRNFVMPELKPLSFDFSDAKDPVVNITNVDSPLLGLLINTSRFYWQEEYRKSGLPLEEYYQMYRFIIDSELLSEEQRQKQAVALLNKLYCNGYLGCKYKSSSFAKAVYVMDTVSSTHNRNNGGSGKGTLAKAIYSDMVFCKISGRDNKMMQNNHCYDRVNPSTRYIIIDDYRPEVIPMGFFYPAITDGLEVNPKGKASFELKYEESPKLVFTSNSVPNDLDASTKRRLLFMPVSDWYHEMTQSNVYQSNHSIVDDFGYDLMQEYTDEQWNQDYALKMQCIQYFLYLSEQNISMAAPEEFLNRRINNSILTEDFEDWAEIYFSDYEHLNVKIERASMFGSYMQATGDTHLSATKFKKMLCAYLEEHNLELNNCDGCNSQGRIIATGKNGASAEFFYVSMKN